MKIAIITDTHFGARNDNLNFNDYFYKFYDNVFFPTLKERDITTCVHIGDVVDRRKYISYRIANDFRSRFIERFSQKGIMSQYTGQIPVTLVTQDNIPLIGAAACF